MVFYLWDFVMLGGILLYKLVALDMDGTMLNENRKLNYRVKDAIRKVREMGVNVILVSGRGYTAIKKFVDELELDEIVVSLNGAAATDCSGEKLIFSENIDKNICKKMILLCEEMEIPTMLFTGNDVFVESINKGTEFFMNHDQAKVKPVGKLSKFFDGQPVGKLLMTEDNQRLVTLRDKSLKVFDDKLTVTFSLPYYLEAYSPNINKGIILEKIGLYYGIKKEEMIAMGDGENDIPMIEYAGMGIAMGNAVQALKDKANYITLTNIEDGVAYALKKYILNCK
jgi:Cof subfamily protein (haloacid dehalogenase superfamily)